MTHPELPEISKPLYINAIVLWAASLAVAVVSLFIDLGSLFAMFIPAIMIEVFWSGAYQRDAIALRKSGNDLFGRIVSASAGVALALFLAAFVAIYPGGPEIVDGAYVRTSHGEVVATLTQKEWTLLTFCERMAQPLVCLSATASLLSGIHLTYQKQHAQKVCNRQPS